MNIQNKLNDLKNNVLRFMKNKTIHIVVYPVQSYNKQ